MDYINKIINTQWFIDINWFDKIILIIENFLKIPLSQIQTLIEKNIEKLQIIYNWKNPQLQKIISEQIYYLKIYNFYIFIKKYNIIDAIYFPFFFDFRGRMYYDSNISVTDCKILRTIYYYGTYNKNIYNNDIDNKYDNLLEKYNAEISFIKNKYKIETNTKKMDISILLLLISIGKFYIKKEDIEIHMDLFIEAALDFLNDNKKIPNKIEDHIEIESYKYILKTINERKKKIVIKDFTASFFQHLTRLLGPTKIETVKLANMHNDLKWRDPYSHILNEFLQLHPDLKYFFYFIRYITKKTIMTIPYSIGELSAWNYFKENIDDLDHLNDKKLRSEYKLFYHFVKKNLEGNEYFKNSTDRMILYAITKTFWLKKFEIKLEKASVHLIYYKSQKKIIDLILNIKSNKIRITKKIHSLDYNNIDYENIAISVRANWIHLLDAECLRKINKEMNSSLYSIHDCVLIDWLNNDKLIITCNTVLGENSFNEVKWDNAHNFKIFSYFIIL